MIPKFRAWDTHEEVMNRVDYVDFVNGVIGMSNEKVRDYEQPIHRVNIMQSTGLKDKNGVEIYEGDIVHWMTEFISPMDMRTKHKIDSNEEVHQKESGEWGMGEVGNTLSEELLNVEVIGNRYENPELLKEQSK